MDTATCCISDAAAGVAAAFRYKEKGSSLARTKVETCLRGDWIPVCGSLTCPDLVVDI